MKAKKVYENIEFERGRDPYSSLGIGNISRRDFSNKDEVIEWAYLYPKAWSEGYIERFDDSDKILRREYRWGATLSVPRIAERKLRLVKWIKDNITINGESLGLRESKDIADRIESKAVEEIQKRGSIKESRSFERGEDPKRSLKIGLKRDFENTFEAALYFYENMDLLAGREVKDGEILFGFGNKPYISKELLSDFNNWIIQDIRIQGQRPGYHMRQELIQEFKGIIKINLAAKELKDKRISLKNESISFERGKDPKKALDIGIVTKIENMVNDEDALYDIISEMDEEIGTAMEVYLPEEKKKKIARMKLSNQYESLPNYEFEVLYQSSDDEDAYDEYGEVNEPKINYEIAEMEAEGWEVLHEEDNFGEVQVILYREV